MIDNKKLKIQIDILKTIAPNSSDEVVKLVELYSKASEAMPKIDSCPKCNSRLEYKKSSFEQYCPSTFYCKKCDHSYGVSFVYSRNQTIDDCTLVFIKKLEGLEKVISK